MSIIHVDDEHFDNEVMKAEGVTVVDFWAPWCAPCRALGPILEETDSDYDGKVKFVKVNIEENAEAAQRFGVRSIPFLVVVKDGEIKGSHTGLLNKRDLSSLVDKHLG